MSRCPAGGASTQVTGSHPASAKNPGSSRAASLTTAGSATALHVTQHRRRGGPRRAVRDGSQGAAGALAAVTGSPRPAHGGGHRVDGGPQPGRVGVGVNLRGGDQGVPEQLLGLVNRPAGVEDVGGERVPHLMRRR